MGSSLFFFLVFAISLYALFQLGQGNPELRALMELKSTLDPEGLVLSSWTTGGEPCLGDFEELHATSTEKWRTFPCRGRELRCLSGLYLHYNELNGEIPREIANLTELTDLYLNVNNLSGSIPSEIGNMASLQVLQLCYNRLTGSIPNHLGVLKKLTVLALQSNLLTGAIPASLGDLTELVRLDLSFNKLFELQRLTQGFQYANNKGLCGSGYPSLHVCISAGLFNPNRPEPYGPKSSSGLFAGEMPQSANLSRSCNGSRCAKHSKSSVTIVVVGIIAFVLCSSVSGLMAFAWYRRRKQRIGSMLEPSDGRHSTDQPKEVFRKSASPLINLEYSIGWDPLADAGSCNVFSQEVSQSFRFNLEEVECATQYFSEVNLLGKSNFASTYKGMLRDGSIVAVKSINKTSCKAEEAEFLKGLKALTLLQHENLVRLKGFCCSRGRGECFLLYDFASNGSLSNYLDVKDDEKEKVLDWSKRVSIINGIAKGIEYLHSSRTNKTPLVHQSISAEKILMDDSFVPKLSGAGLHKLLADDVVFSTLKASAAMGYLAPEYTTTGRFTVKSDVYSFGVIVFQILTGKTRVAGLRLCAESGQLENLVDKNLGKSYSIPEAAKLACIALVCTSETPSQRPTMEAVLQELGSNC
ncbi:hypothetical protein HPP92_014279 [Vanilla planifolia]|uniref:Protein kinase domain-containing protein n=1 Tax=Vanilla planifolia TaxID=51239 RepID=A0A835UUM4_VANPL|nr:hypothetical protein HPP92_014279 [Vanilla planifolia]